MYRDFFFWRVAFIPSLVWGHFCNLKNRFRTNLQILFFLLSTKKYPNIRSLSCYYKCRFNSYKMFVVYSNYIVIVKVDLNLLLES